MKRKVGPKNLKETLNFKLQTLKQYVQTVCATIKNEYICKVDFFIFPSKYF